MRRFAVTFILSIVAAFVLWGQENRQPRGESLLKEGLRLYGNYMDLGDTTARSRALDVLEEALHIFVEGKDIPNASECLVGLASIYSDRSESMSLSKELYQWAFELQGEALTEAGFTAAAGLSVLDYHLGYPDLARKSLEICDLLLEYFTEIKPAAISGTSLAGCLSAMGMAAYLLEEPERAVRYYDRMEKQPLPADADVLATAGVVCGLVDYSMIQSDLGNLEKALELLKKVKAIYDSSQYKLVATLSRFSQASGTILLRAGLYQDAVEFFETAAVINDQLCGEFDLNTIHAVKQVASAYGYCDRFDEANQLFKNLVEEIGAIYGQDSREMFTTWVDWSVSLIRQHDYETAIQACQIANGISKKLDVTLHQGYVNGILAALYKGDEKLAATFAADAFGLVKDYCKQRLAFLDERSRDRFWAMRGVNYLNSIMAGASSPSDGSGVLFDAALLSKGLLMNASRELEHFFRALQEGDALQTYQTLKQAKDRMAYLYSGTQDEQIEARQMQEDAAGLERRLMAQVKQYGDFLQYTDCSWKDVAACLGPDDVCVEFVRFTLSEKSHYYAAVLVPGKNPVNVKLPDVTDDLLLGQRPEALYSGKSDLYRKVFAPLEPMLKRARTVYFSPAGVLHSVALESVVSPDGTRMNERYKMKRMSSSRELLKGFSRETRWNKAVLFGGIDYDAEAVPGQTAAAKSRGQVDLGWSYLPGTLEEVNQIRKLLATTETIVLSGADAGSGQFKALSGSGTNLIHVATHGYYDKTATSQLDEGYDDETMLQSGLVMAGANRDGEGLLSSHEISRLDLEETDLAVLSACGTGLSPLQFDESYGLVRAFKKAGCQSILMTLWDVDDERAQEFMVEFYRARTAGSDKEESLRTAGSLIRTKYPDTLDWAAFVLLD